jgi:hypothetical protein
LRYIKSLRPFISVQHAKAVDVRKRLGSFWISHGNAFALGQLLGASENEILDSMKRISDDDLSQMIITLEYSKRQVGCIVEPKLNCRTNRIHKLEDFCYVQFVQTIENFKSENSSDMVYIIENIIVIQNGEEWCIVRTFCPTLSLISPGKAAGKIDTWLQSFFVLAR